MTVTQEAILSALFIFGLRVFNSAIGTMRLVVVARGQRWLTSILGFIEALIFAFVTANVVTDLSNMLNLVAYCGGLSSVMAAVYAVNPQAFITMEEARAVQHGWLRALRHTR